MLQPQMMRYCCTVDNCNEEIKQLRLNTNNQVDKIPTPDKLPGPSRKKIYICSLCCVFFVYERLREKDRVECETVD